MSDEFVKLVRKSVTEILEAAVAYEARARQRPSRQKKKDRPVKDLTQRDNIIEVDFIRRARSG